jgi:hypothetical protein
LADEIDDPIPGYQFSRDLLLIHALEIDFSLISLEYPSALLCDLRGLSGEFLAFAPGVYPERQ